MIFLFSSIVLFSGFGGSGLAVETLHRSKSGTVRSYLGTTDYQGTEWELLFSSRTVVDDLYVFNFFGGFTKALSLESNGVTKDVSSYPLGWFYGAGNAIQVPFVDGSAAEVSVGYDSAYLQYNGDESRVDHLRIGLRFIQTSFDGLQFSLGLEYSKPLWGRVSSDTGIIKYRYTGSAFAVSVGVGYQSW
ncbi:MAG: hypothetical protein GX626_11590 [Spirochaetales bacterium]|nr:hypothetical protein [Spirochaetales bacterium]